jgi:hypothetical protein
LHRWIEHPARRLARLVAAAGAGVAIAAAAGGAQADTATIHGSLFERLNLDKLRLSAIGASVGGVKPSQIEATRSYALYADYGEIAPHWRVVFSATYWGSHYTDETMQRFADSLGKVIVDPTNDYTIDIGRVSVSDIALDMDLRWSPRRSLLVGLRPYAGGGLGVHVLNAEGKSISGTVVERALDNITAGLTGSAGIDVVLFRQISLGMQARYDLLSGARFGSLRAVGSYLLRRTPPPGTHR